MIESLDSDVQFEAATDFNLWGCCRKPRNVCEESFRNAVEAGFVHSSLQNIIDNMGKDVADVGNVMLLFEGRGEPIEGREVDTYPSLRRLPRWDDVQPESVGLGDV